MADLRPATTSEDGLPMLPEALASCEAGYRRLRLLRQVERQALLSDAVLVLHGADAVEEEARAERRRELAAFVGDLARPAFLLADRRLAWVSELPTEVVPVAMRPPGSADREVLWTAAVRALPTPADPGLRLRDLARKYNLSPGRILGAVQGARLLADLRGSEAPVTQADLVRATTDQLGHRLSEVADRVERTSDWDDLILPDETLGALRDIACRYRHQDKVMGDWGFQAKFAYGYGITCLFSGPPGTGKTMSAGVLARELDMELFRVDLSRIVSKWVGETEKNLASVFDEGKASHAIILFDEADSLFGQRGKVRSSADRYSNLEVNYLLQRMESYEGISMLTTNQPQSIDDAFKRRITFTIPFLSPDADTRARLWTSMFPPEADVAEDVDADWLGEEFEFSGGQIKNSV